MLRLEPVEDKHAAEINKIKQMRGKLTTLQKNALDLPRSERMRLKQQVFGMWR